MRTAIGRIAVGLGFLVYLGSGIVLPCIFFYGIYAIFAKSVAVGLMLIGAATVGSFISLFAAGLLMTFGAACAGEKSL